VEHSRRVWARGHGEKVLRVVTRNIHSPVWRGVRPANLVTTLTGKLLTGSETHGKQMLFQFGRDVWLGVHLGMTGDLSLKPMNYRLGKHDHLALQQANHWLVFTDQRRFGRLRLAQGTSRPNWWTRLPPPILSTRFTKEWVAEFCARRQRTPLKALLLMQERFPGIGNWMADEILWRARLSPKIPAGKLTPAAVGKLYRSIRWVTASALKQMDENWEFPATWLFTHRWEAGGLCPRCGAKLAREKIGGRTTCWCPVEQPSQSSK
jgi:formamidopyrimidine-DNA glycosylase